MQGPNDQDQLYPEDASNERVGRMVLPSTFVGSPRYYNKQFQDGMAVCRKFHKPDLFITVTCNPNWPEIQENLLPGQTAHDRPDITARVFKLKVDAVAMFVGTLWVRPRIGYFLLVVPLLGIIS